MIRAHVVAFQSIALTLTLAAASATSAHALPHFGIHRTPATQQDGRVSLYLYNKSASFRDLQIDGHVYTVQPHQSIAIKTPIGTEIITETTGNMHRKGDLLFAVSPDMQNHTVSID